MKGGHHRRARRCCLSLYRAGSSGARVSFVLRLSPRRKNPHRFNQTKAAIESDPVIHGENAVGLSWQQRPLSTGAIGRFLVPEPLPKRLLYVERLRRRMRVRFGGRWIAESDRVLLLFEPGRYPVAYFPEVDLAAGALERTEHTTQHTDHGLTSWYIVHACEQHVADTRRALVLYESGFAPRWYVPRADIDEAALTPVKLQTFCPYKGLCSYYSIGEARQAAWCYPDAYAQVASQTSCPSSLIWSPCFSMARSSISIGTVGGSAWSRS
jgi:uncharacterized protein (DUF427 family)